MKLNKKQKDFLNTEIARCQTKNELTRFVMAKYNHNSTIEDYICKRWNDTMFLEYQF